MALVEPSLVHVYKPLQNYVGVGLGRVSELKRSQADLIPAGVHGYQSSATHVDPVTNLVHCADGTVVRGADLLLAPGARISLGCHTGCPGWTAGGTGLDLLPVGPAGPHHRDYHLRSGG